MTENKRFMKRYIDEFNSEIDMMEEDILIISDELSGKIYPMDFLDDDEKEKIIDDIVNNWNELNDENQILKASNEEYEDALGRLEEENNDLKNNLCAFNELNRPLGTIIEENRHLKAFIKQLTNNCGEIVLMNGNAYDVKKILGDVE